MKPIFSRLKCFRGIRAGMDVDEISIDFSTIPDGIIALTGPSGIGKTTFFDNWHHYRLMPYQLRKSKDWSPAAFSFYEECYGADAEKEFISEDNGKLYRSLLLIDAEKRRCEAYFYEKDGNDWKSPDGWAPLNDGKTGTFDAVVEKIMGSPTLFFTSEFRSQGAKNLSDYSRSNIMALIAELLNIDHISLQGEKSRKVITALTDLMARDNSRLSTLNDELATEPEISEELKRIGRTIDEHKIALTDAKMSREENEKAVADIERKKLIREAEEERLSNLNIAQADDMSEKDENERKLLEIAGKVVLEKGRIIKDFNTEEEEIENEKASLKRELSEEKKIELEKKEKFASQLRESFVAEECEIAKEKLLLQKELSERDDVWGKTKDKLNRQIERAKKVIDIGPNIRKKVAEKDNANEELANLKVQLEGYEVEKEELSRKEKKMTELKETITRSEADIKVLQSRQESNIRQLLNELQQVNKEALKLNGIDCNGVGRVNDSCRFIKDAVIAKSRIPDLEKELAEKQLPDPELTQLKRGLDTLRPEEKDLSPVTSQVIMCNKSIRDMREAIFIKEKALEEISKWTVLLPELEQAEINLAHWEEELNEKNREFEHVSAQVLVKIASLDAKIAFKSKDKDDRIALIEKEFNEKCSLLSEKVSSKVAALDEKMVQKRKERDARLAAAEKEYDEGKRVLAGKQEAILERVNARHQEIYCLIESTKIDLVAEFASLDKKADDIRKNVARIEEAISNCGIRTGILECKLREFKGKKEESKRLEERTGLFNREITKFSWLARGCSNDGIIPLEISDSGPTISTYANDLLTSYGPRFSIRFETQSLNGDGSVKEDFDIVVYDAEAGEEKSITKMSGGQVLWLEDAITKAICIFNLSRSGRQVNAIFSDEKDGSFDIEKKIEFMGVKRRLLGLGTHKQEFFITHSQELQEMADARIVLQRGGRVALT